MAAVPVGGTLKLSDSTPISEALTIDKDMTVAANGAVISAPVTVSGASVTIDGANIVASGTSASDKTAAITVSGDGDFTLTNNTISGKSRNAILVRNNGKQVIEGNTFDAGTGNIYNAIEFSINTMPDVTDAVVENNTFTGTLGNNAISMYNFAEGANVLIKNNTFSDIATNNNPIRLSNPKNASVTFDIEDNTYSFNSEEPQEYTGFMLLQDYATGGGKQDFGKFTINFVNLKRGDKKLTENGTGLDRVFYVYDDQDGLLEAGVNDPVVNFS